MRSFKVNEATKYTTLFDFISTPCWFAMNQAKWDSLPADIKKIFEETTGEVMTRAIALALDKGLAEDTAAMKKDGQVFIVPAAKEKAHLGEILTPVLKKVWLEDLARANCTYADPEGLYKKACELMKKNEGLYGRK
jgi:TRAP-type C4-dicarboxylate transport system substrate-binding protein